MNELTRLQCSADAGLLAPEQITKYMASLDSGREPSDDGKSISRVFSFANYYGTIVFVNLVAAVAHSQDHHPDMNIGYNRCRVEYSTHSAGGLTDNDFICAAKIDMMSRI